MISGLGYQVECYIIQSASMILQCLEHNGLHTLFESDFG